GVDEPGPLWAATNSLDMMQRTCGVLNTWFQELSTGALEWWAMGRGPGGGLSMNDSIVANIMVLRSVFDHLRDLGHRLDSVYDEELQQLIRPYAHIVGKYLGGFTTEQRQGY